MASELAELQQQLHSAEGEVEKQIILQQLNRKKNELSRVKETVKKLQQQIQEMMAPDQDEEQVGYTCTCVSETA